MNIKPVKSYAFRDIFGNNLTMVIGCVEGSTLPVGYRVKMIGNRIPFPVRCGTWFNSGMGIDGLCLFMAENEYALVSITDMTTGYTSLHKLPDDAAEVSDETFVTVEKHHVFVENVVKAAQILRDNNEDDLAIEMIRDMFGFNLKEARKWFCLNVEN